MVALLDPAERSRIGSENQARLLAATPTEPATLYEASWRDYVFAEVWTRPGLDLRSRYLIAMGTAANEGDAEATQSYARGALFNRELTLAELREASLHIGVYAGWTTGGVMDAAISRAVDELGMPPANWAPIRDQPWDPAMRTAIGAESFEFNMHFSRPPLGTAYFEAGIVNFVFGEMWNRPGLDQRSRRWLTLVGVGNSSAHTPIHSHVWSAMKSGNATTEEMYEFVLQYAIHAGWPRGSVMQGAVREQSRRLAEGLPHTG